MADEKIAEVATEITAHEYDRDGVIISQNGVMVSAFEVDHGELVKPAYGYRIDYAGRSVVISGDTKFGASGVVVGRARG